MKRYILRILTTLQIIFTFQGMARVLPQDSAASSVNENLADSLWVEMTRDSLTNPLSVDSAVIHGSDYGSFADIFAVLPGSYFYNRGSVGQLALGALFAAPAGRFTLDYDGLILNDLLTAYPDLNLIPTESITRIGIPISPKSCRYGFNATGQALQLTSVDMASLPIKSRVAYRTGYYGFDDIDVRLGVQASPRLRLNAGGILKNYIGTQLHSKYRAQKVNVKMDRRIGRNWFVRYLFLMNKFDLDVPEYQPVVYLNSKLAPHQKDERYDHGIFLHHRGNFLLGSQLTDLHREFYGNRRALLDQKMDAEKIRVISQYSGSVKIFEFQFGSQYQYLHVNDPFNTPDQWHVSGWMSLFSQSANLRWQAKLNYEKHKGFPFALAPELNLSLSPSTGWQVMLWMNRNVRFPDVASRFISSPYVLANDKLNEERYQQMGLALTRRSEKLEVTLTSSIGRIENQICRSYDSTHQQIPTFINLESYLRQSVTMTMSWKYSHFLQLFLKLRQLFVHEANINPANEPGTFACGYLQFSRLLFQGDLNAHVRIGFFYYGGRSGPSVYYAEFSPQTEPLAPVVVPFIHGIFDVGKATLFVSVNNPLRQKYQVVYGYPMPLQLFRWGFVWRFYD